MGQTTWARTEEANLGILNTKLRKELMKEIFLARFAGFTEVKVDKRTGRKEYKPSGAGIEILKDFVNDGMDHMLVPMLRELRGTPTYGDNQLWGNEEELDLYYNKVYINQIRHAVASSGRASEQRVKALKIAREKEPMLRRWLARVRDYQLAKTFYEGWSPQITETTANGGLYINSGQKRPHPNFYTAGAGQVTWNADDATYEGLVEDALTAMTDTAANYFSTSLIEAMRVEVQKLGIKPLVTADGEEFIVWLIHPNQARQLRAENDWKNANNELRSDNPLFKNALGKYAGFVFFERELSVFGANPDSATGTVTFGASNPLSAVDTYPRKCSIIFGAGAISTGVAMDAFIEPDDYDYKNQRGVSIGMITGDARGEFYDSTSGKSAVINQSSAIVASYSDNSFA